ncbi:MAG: gephyrin-like molybdotransferase Glp [Thermodesulfobacteriota bacterium]|nr:gephyrin-like molybdotransferase Glp [Thermodesulfobacteriota bacterium]
MISVEEARESILSRISILPKEKVVIDKTLGRYLAENIVSDRNIPLWDNSAMDGYALHHEDIISPKTRLKIIYDLPAGSSPKSPVKNGEAVRIMTGAPMPPGSDAVVKREDTIETPDEIIVLKPPQKDENVRYRGEDIKEGETILSKGDYIGPAQAGILASLQRSSVYCYQRPVVAILATGNELIDIDGRLSPGAIVASNSYTLTSLVKICKAIPLYLGISKDNKKELQEFLLAAKRADLILTSGGVSVGDYDIVKEVMSSKKNHVEFWQVEMKPGKPLVFGNIGDTPAIGLPGNPVSSMVSFYQFARPAILKMMGVKNLLLPRVTAKIKTSIRKKTDRRHYLRGILKRDGADLTVDLTGPQGSGILSSMSKANCLIVLPKEKGIISSGEMVECEVIQASWE